MAFYFPFSPISLSLTLDVSVRITGFLPEGKMPSPKVFLFFISNFEIIFKVDFLPKLKGLGGGGLGGELLMRSCLKMFVYSFRVWGGGGLTLLFDHIAFQHRLF